MLDLKSFYVKNYHLWPSASLRFEPGITLVTGANRSGKTLLFRALSMLLRAQAVKRGSSLSRLPKGSQLGLEFAVHGEPWHARLTPATLNLNRGGADQGSTGKKAPRTLLTQTLALPVELFDSTIHLSGTGDHPLITGLPSKKLEWVSAVLDLTDAYDTAALAVAVELERASLAATKLEMVTEELAGLELPAATASPERLRQELEEVQVQHQELAQAAQWVESWQSLHGTHSATTLARAIETARAKQVRLRRALGVAQAYANEDARADTVARLEESLAALPAEPVQARTLADFCAALNRVDSELTRLHREWRNSSADRAMLAHLRQTLARAPAQLDEVLRSTQAQADNAARQIKNLRHLRGSHCPLCQAKISAARREDLAAAAEAVLRAAGPRLEELKRYEEAASKAQRLEDRLAGVQVPPLPGLGQIRERYAARAAAASDAQRLRRRLADLKTGSGLTEPRPAHSVAQLETALLQLEERLTKLTLHHDAATRASALEARISAACGTDWEPDEVLAAAAAAATRYAHLLTTVGAAEAAANEVRRVRERRCELEDRAAALRTAAARLPELLELKDAMGPRGLRLSKIKDLALAFQAEFNNLVPLLWDDPFVLDIEVKPTGMELYATRNGAREDLHSLSGSEMKGWKLLTALCLIRLLPDRLRCNTIILDELEANMDPTTRQRFVADFLPELRRYVDCVVLVSPLDYRDLPLAPSHLLQVVKSGETSRLESRAAT